MEFFSENLIAYGELGYQIVFDEHGLRVWYRFCIPTVKLYEGVLLEDAVEAIEKHICDNKETYE